MLGGFATLQDRLLYFPARAPVEEMVSSRLRAWPTPAAFRGLVAEPAGAPRGTAVVFHGNAGHAGHRGYYVDALARLGLRVILAEYPGYGPREGPLGERSFVADARQTVALAYERYGPPLVLVGESLGAAVAAASAREHHDRLAGLLLITPWDRLESVASHHYPWLPMKRLLRDRYDTAASLASVRIPVLVVVAEEDRIVPARFGAALHAGLEGPARLVVIDGAGHNDWPDRVDDGWWAERVSFLLDARSPSGREGSESPRQTPAQERPGTNEEEQGASTPDGGK